MAGHSSRWRGANRALLTAFGSTNPWVLVGAFVLLIALGWFGDALRRMLDVPDLLALALLPLATILLVLGARKAVDTGMRVRQDQDLLEHRAMIMFLSWPGDTDYEGIASSVLAGGGDLAAVAAGMGRASWRMPLVAIAGQTRLDYLFVIPSRDTTGWGGAMVKGSLNDAARFKGLVESLLLQAERDLRVRIMPPIGVDYENAQEVAEALRSCVDGAVAEGVAENDVIVDITGGKAICSAIGAVSAMGEPKFQYVSTSDYQVHTYDVRWDKD